MNSLKFQLENKDKTKTVSGVYVETNESAQLFFSEAIGGKESHILKAKDVKHPEKLIASYIARIDVDVKFHCVFITDTNTRVDIERAKTEKSNIVIEYNLPNTDVYLPSGTVLSTVVDGKVFEINIEKIASKTREKPVDNKYTNNDELNKYIAMFGIPYDVFKKYNLAVSFNNFLGKLRNGDVDSIAVPKSTIYVPTSSFYKYNMYKSDSPITRKNSYIRRSSRFDVYEMKKDS